MPLKEIEVDVNIPFAADERLYRRVSPGGLNNAGEFLPSALNTFSFDKDLDSAPSVMRGAFCDWNDVLAFDCADQELVGWMVYYVTVGELPQSLTAADGRVFAFFPVHRPKPLCGAHSVIASYVALDETRKYVPPPRPVRNALRTILATTLKLATQP